MLNRRSCFHLKPSARRYSSVCGCLLERVQSRVLYFPCVDHFGLDYEVEVRPDGGASLFCERAPFFAALRKRGLMQEGT